MAMTYQNFASLGVNLNRQKYGPLDISNVFTSAADLKYYLTKGTFTEGVSTYWYKNANEKIVPYPYEGQVLATVIDGVVSVYALALDADGNFQTQEIGAKIETDDKTIKLVDGKLELVGLPAVTAGKTFVPSLVNGVLTWAEPDTSTAEGQQQAIDGLTTRMEAVETTINGKAESEEGAGDAVVGLVDKVAALEAVDNATQAELDAYKEVVTAAIAAGVKEAKDYADAQDADTVYDDSDLQTRVKAIEDDYLKEADKYDDTELSGRVSAIETDYIDSTKLADAIKDFTTKTYVDGEIDKIEEAIANITHFTTKVVTSIDEVTEVGVLYLIKDESVSGSDKYNEYIVVDGAAVLIGDTTTDLSNYYNKTEIDGKVETLEGAIADEAEAREALAEEVEALKAVDNATQEELDAYKLEVTAAIGTAKSEAISAAAQAEEAKGYAVAADVAATYATKDALAEAVEGIENDLLSYDTSAQVDTKLADKADKATTYTKAEVDGLIGKPGTPAQGEEGTEGYIPANPGTGVYQHVYSKDEVTKLIADITGGESAADVLAALNAYKTTNDTRVKNVEDAIGRATSTDDEGTVTPASGLHALIEAAQKQADKGVADAAKVAADLVTANLAIAENTRQIGVVDGKIDTINETLSGSISALENADTLIKSDITSLQTLVSGDGGHSSRILALEGRATNLETKDAELLAAIQANTNKFADYSTTAQVQDLINTAVSDKLTAADLAPYAKTAEVNAALELKANAADVYTKTEADAAFMTEGEVDARINALIVAADPEGGKTITDIQNLVKYVDENAGEIAALVTTVGGHTTAIEKNTTDIASITSQLAAIVQPKASTEITVAADGTLGIGEVNVNKLVQTEGDELIICGGTAGSSKTQD